MAAQLVVALLAFTSLSVASDPNCTELVKPLVLDSHSPVSISQPLLCEEEGVCFITCTAEFSMNLT